MYASARLVGPQVNDHTGPHGLRACTCDIQGPQSDLEGSCLSGPLIQSLLSYLSLQACLQVGTCRSLQGLQACWSIAKLICTSLRACTYGVHFSLSFNGPAPEFYFIVLHIPLLQARSFICPQAPLQALQAHPFIVHLILNVTVLFPHRSVLLFFHTHCLLTWRGRRLYTNTSYLFICTISSICFFDLSTDLANS